MIAHKTIGKQGRIGNQLFQIAFILSQAKKRGVKAGFNPWPFAQYFQGDFSQRPPDKMIEVKEPAFHHTPHFYDSLDFSKDLNFSGYFQSWKYWNTALVHKAFTFKPEFVQQVLSRQPQTFQKPVIALHVRRGDYIGHKGYENLTPCYYLSALEKHFPDWREQNLLFFSDEPEYVKQHFKALPNAYFANGSEIEDLCLMAQCQSFIIANSSFSWWGAWLSGSKNVVRPARHFRGDMEERNDIRDLYPPTWTAHEAERLNLRDVTFTIPVAFDSMDRIDNLKLCLALLFKDFDTNVVVMEQGGDKFSWAADFCEYRQFGGEEFHRTRMLNQMAQEADTPIIVNFDADVMFPPAQILQAVHLIRQGADVAYPYAGQFVRMERLKWYKRIWQSLDIGTAAGFKFQPLRTGDLKSAGGAVFFNRESFFRGGGENENFISFAPEDAERLHRFTLLGFDVQRVRGELYHMEHFCGVNSGVRHPRIAANRAEWRKVERMNKEELAAYVESWNVARLFKNGYIYFLPSTI